MSHEEEGYAALRKYAAAVIDSEITYYRAMSRRVLMCFKHPKPRSCWTQDLTAIAGEDVFVGIVRDAQRHAMRVYDSILEHLRTIELVLSSGRELPVAAWTNARVVLEGVLYICWLADADAATEKRIARAATILPQQIEGKYDALEKFPSSVREAMAARQLRSNKRALAEVYAEVGLDLVHFTDKDGKPLDAFRHIVYKGEKAAFRSNTTQLAETYLPNDQKLYHLLSGAAHGKAWFLNGTVTDGYDEFIDHALQPLSVIGDTFRTAIERYFDLDLRMMRKERVARNHALLMELRG